MSTCESWPRFARAAHHVLGVSQRSIDTGPLPLTITTKSRDQEHYEILNPFSIFSPNQFIAQPSVAGRSDRSPARRGRCDCDRLRLQVAAKPTASYDAKWGGGFMSPKQFTGLVFEGV
jgi:hypothetical protein